MSMGGLWIALCLLVAAPAWAADYTHTVQAGETLESLAKQYYGSSWKAVYIASKNGVTEAAPGKRLVIPAGFTYRVKKGDSVAIIAKRYLGDTDRYKILMQENGLRDANDLAVGQELLLPFVLRHTVASGEGLSQIARHYYRNSRRMQLIRDYNKSGDALDPGDRLSVPIFDRSTLDPKSRKPSAPVKATAQAEPASEEPAKEAGDDDAPKEEPAKEETPQELSVSARQALKESLERFDKGELEESCVRLESLLTETGFATRERALVVSTLGFCAVAAGDRSAARDYFTKWLELVPTATLDPILTSPKILDVFQEVVAARRAE